MNPIERQPNNENESNFNNVEEGGKIEGIDKIPIRVNDLRGPNEKSFDLDKFLAAIGRLKSEGLYEIRGDFRESDYGKYMSVFASTESDNWAGAIEEAKAIEITLTTELSRGHHLLMRPNQTRVEIKVLMGDKSGRVFDFYFQDGKYRRAGFRDVYLQPRLGEDKGPEGFTLDIIPDTKEIN